jgi:ADP-ribose pyrophosphatase
MTFEEKTLKTEQIYSGKILNLRRDKVTTVNGGTAYREIIEHPGGVVLAAITGDDKMVMVRQFRKAVEKVVFEAPAGKLEHGEEIIQAAIRELKEETGYTAKQIESMGSYFSSCGYTSEKLHIFLCRDLSPGQTEFDEHEALIVEEYPLKDLFQQALSGRIDDAKTALAIILAYEKTR